MNSNLPAKLPEKLIKVWQLFRKGRSDLFCWLPQKERSSHETCDQ
jgi:hypothetical protein